MKSQRQDDVGGTGTILYDPVMVDIRHSPFIKTL